MDALTRLRAGTSLDEALAFYDSLPAAPIPLISGWWSGSSVPTGNPLDGLLEAYGWAGKRFDGPDGAHPLVFDGPRGRFSVNPAAVPLGFLLRFHRPLHHPVVAGLARRILPAARTFRPKARLRMMAYRGVVTATMSYDALPINDHVRLIDDHTLLGAMDCRGLPQPFLFLLEKSDRH